NPAGFKISFPLKTADRRQYFQQLFRQARGEQDESVPITSYCLELEPDDPKIIAFYLPQFHPFPENDSWWGKGFTEWTNVSKAVPQFIGHYQPRLPGELGFYDLRLKEVQERQIQLAKQYGIYGFCYHHYWFGGQRLMEKPAGRAINGEMHFPFCLCWANENWTRRWDGEEHEVLISQEHSPEDDLAFIEDITPALSNKYYIRVDGKPLLIVYRVNLLPDAAATAQRWRQYCRKNSIGEIYLVAAQAHGITDPRQYGFDAAVEFPPHKFYAPGLNNTEDIVNPNFKGRIFDYSYLAEESKTIHEEDYSLYRTVIPSWDNEARLPGRGHIYHRASPALYQKWLTNTCRHTSELPANKENYLFVNAWNEWAEGAYIEPDRKFGYAYLQATANAILTSRALTEKEPLISVVIPAYNHEQYIYESLLSVTGQTYKNFEIIIINDGSTDNTAHEIRRFIKDYPRQAITFANQDNMGPQRAIHNALQKAKGTFIALLNSDDMYSPRRLDKMISAMRKNNSCFAFSNITFIQEEGGGKEAESETADYIGKIESKLKGLKNQRNIIYALLDFNVAVSSGNFIFGRWIYDQLQGFSTLNLAHDWDFILEATFLTKPIFVDAKLYKYRIHPENTYKKLNHQAIIETEAVLSKFLAKYKTNFTLFETQFDQAEFNRFVNNRGYNKYLKK
ncbi:MAG TPA: glycosyltransferase, partial [Desulfobacterales bacterium]|nr:glycosyltransferase [Desulfobacterales bacterium]